jgi:hypothetical protein
MKPMNKCFLVEIFLVNLLWEYYFVPILIRILEKEMFVELLYDIDYKLIFFNI